jgi:hypothetical protein
MLGAFRTIRITHCSGIHTPFDEQGTGAFGGRFGVIIQRRRRHASDDRRENALHIGMLGDRFWNVVCRVGIRTTTNKQQPITNMWATPRRYETGLKRGRSGQTDRLRRRHACAKKANEVHPLGG